MIFIVRMGAQRGAADQYVLDYARTYGLKCTVFRMSCIYGVHQQGNEDQGWVAHFARAALKGESINIYGDGHQVRDILYIDDLVDAFLLAAQNIDSFKGTAVNIGGGKGNAVSLRQVIQLFQELNQDKIDLHFDQWRTGDQKYYVSDTRKMKSLSGWQPAVDYHAGISKLYNFVKNHLDDISAKNGVKQPKEQALLSSER